MALARQTQEDMAAEEAATSSQEPARQTTQDTKETPEESPQEPSAGKGRLKDSQPEPRQVCDKPDSEPIDAPVPVIAEPVEGSPSSSGGREVADSQHSSSKDSSLSSGMVVVSSVRTTPSPDSTTTKGRNTELVVLTNIHIHVLRP